ncbi:unnamed protein product [Blepharisma stoltei]|uniref:Uncharacterized protein n=1 Tax=Blepharisma stoltei TaxID=1481888 RepID=A0AAU9KAV1_9CILI|nr:unnamed protein product [Blepharisma stoltei]
MQKKLLYGEASDEIWIYQEDLESSIFSEDFGIANNLDNELIKDMLSQIENQVKIINNESKNLDNKVADLKEEKKSLIQQICDASKDKKWNKNSNKESVKQWDERADLKRKIFLEDQIIKYKIDKEKIISELENVEESMQEIKSHMSQRDKEIRNLSKELSKVHHEVERLVYLNSILPKSYYDTNSQPSQRILSQGSCSSRKESINSEEIRARPSMSTVDESKSMIIHDNL